MKKIRFGFIVVAAALAAVCMAGCVESADAPVTAEPAESRIVIETPEQADKNTLNVSAEGKVTMMPDVAYVTIGVVTQHKDAKKAQENNREDMAAVVQALKDAGLTDDDMKTVNYYVGPNYVYDDDNGRRISSYEVTNTVQLTIKDTDNVGQYIDIAAENGANTAHPVTFALLEPEAAYADALVLAMENAIEKAEALAAAGGFKIAGPINVSESGGSGYYPNDDAVYRVMEAAEAEADMPETVIQASELEITANVSVQYEITG